MAFKDLFDGDARSKADLRQEIALRDEEIAKLGQTLSQVRASAAAEKSRAVEVALRSKTDQAQTEDHSLRAEIRSLQIRLTTKEETVVSLRKQIKQNEHRLSDRESQNAALRKQLVELEALISAQEARIASINQPISKEAAKPELIGAEQNSETSNPLTSEKHGSKPPTGTITLGQNDVSRQNAIGIEKSYQKTIATLEQQIIDYSQQTAEYESKIKQLEELYAKERTLRREKECATDNIRFNYEKLKQTVSNNEFFKNKYDQLRTNSIARSEHKQICDQLRKDFRAEGKKHEKAQNKLATLEAALKTTKDEVTRLRSVLKSYEKSRNTEVSTSKFESPFLHPRVLSWLLKDVDISDTPDIPNGWLGYSGEKPWSEVQFYESIKGCGFEFWNLPDSDLVHLILGHKNWSETKLLEQIDVLDGGHLRIYSQEMFIAKLITGRDPFDAGDDELLYAFAENHAALTYLIGLSKPWPEICFSHDDDEEVEYHSDEDFQVSASPMSLMGYHVGASSPLTTSERRKVLTKIFEQMHLEFSEDSNPPYVKKWGRGASAQRLYRMAVHIKWLVETQGKDYRKTQARDEWISDLDWLRKTYYARVMHIFAWP